MDSSTAVPSAAAWPESLSSKTLGSLLYCRILVFAATCILVGIVWDISWHSTIGRDTFWTAAHICIHIGGTLGGLTCGWLVLNATFSKNPCLANSGVHVWGFRGPLGAWVTIWGALAMLTSAPFDNWWHDAYGLDVEILSPPHSVLAAGMFFHVVGGLLLVLAYQNRSADQLNAGGRWLYAFAAGILVSLAAIMLTEKSLPNQQHSASFYKISCGVYPFFLVALARASRLKWPATTIAGIYMALTCAGVWILPLFHAQPMLAPIYNPLTHMAPPMFPLLLVVPTFAMDLAFRWIGRGRGWRRDLLLAPAIALAFSGLFIATQWQFSKFLISPAAENRFFAGCGFFTFADQRTEMWNKFWFNSGNAITGESVVICCLIAIVTSAAGLSVGNWMARVQR